MLDAVAGGGLDRRVRRPLPSSSIRAEFKGPTNASRITAALHLLLEDGPAGSAALVTVHRSSCSVIG
jgi:hypothetical protein